MGQIGWNIPTHTPTSSKTILVFLLCGRMKGGRHRNGDLADLRRKAAAAGRRYPVPSHLGRRRRRVHLIEPLARAFRERADFSAFCPVGAPPFAFADPGSSMMMTRILCHRSARCSRVRVRGQTSTGAERRRRRRDDSPHRGIVPATIVPATIVSLSRASIIGPHLVHRESNRRNVPSREATAGRCVPSNRRGMSDPKPIGGMAEDRETIGEEPHMS